MLPSDEPDSSSSSTSSPSEISSSSSSNNTYLPTSSSRAATAEWSGMFVAVLRQLRAELAEEKRQRMALEARQRELATQLYCIVDEQIQSVKAIKKLVQNLREGKEDNLREMLGVMTRMKNAWRRKRPKSSKRMWYEKKRD